VRRADGYDAQFCIDVDPQEELPPTGKVVGIELGLKCFYEATDGTVVENPRFLRQRRDWVVKQARALVCP